MRKSSPRELAVRGGPPAFTHPLRFPRDRMVELELRRTLHAAADR
jgi:hypothetical protein